ncbi:MAG: hypothetical protein GX821_06260 [Clostridiaceae bacterium]|jgi:hypothetical protein|nr:hypothetical protein [Clostridiaceae bacterium]
MKNKKILLMTAIVTVLVLGLATVSFAATEWKTPAEILAGLTGKSVEAVQEARQEGQSYGAQAAAADKLEAFRDERLAQVENRLKDAVEDGQLTEEEAAQRLETMQERAETCDGSGLGQAEGGLRIGGQGNGRRGEQAGDGLGQGNGNKGSRRMNGSCLTDGQG